ncbi:MAG: hypothetical protein E7163_02535 [Firmicutes bacterium]|nr:hypothetical protein [Bacillota bacterium]
MSKAKYKNKAIYYKNYLLGFGVVLGIIFIILYINKWHQVKEQEKYLNSYLMSNNTINLEITDINAIDSVLSETPNYYFVYISYTQDKKVYNLEKNLKPIIDNYDLQNNFYFINITNIKDKNKNYKEEIAKELKIGNNYINNIPVILYFKNGELINSVNNSKDFENLLKEQNIRSM